MKKNMDVEAFIDGLKTELKAWSDEWKEQARQCPRPHTEWAYCATVSGVLFSLSHAIGKAMDNARKKGRR